MMETTLVILKPDTFSRRLNHTVDLFLCTCIHEAGLRIDCSWFGSLTREFSEQLYHTHKLKEFFPRLIEFMVSGKVLVYIISGADAVSEMRRIALGVRGCLDLKVEPHKNLIHASSDLIEAVKEIALFNTIRRGKK
jgi:nucleoside-diphosphate kinase